MGLDCMDGIHGSSRLLHSVTVSPIDEIEGLLDCLDRFNFHIEQQESFATCR